MNLKKKSNSIKQKCITVFYNYFATIFRTLMLFFTTLDTKLKAVITFNTGCLIGSKMKQL